MTEKSKRSPWLLSNVGLDDERADKISKAIDQPEWWVDGVEVIVMRKSLLNVLEMFNATGPDCTCKMHKSIRYVLKHQCINNDQAAKSTEILLLSKEGKLLKNLNAYEILED